MNQRDMLGIVLAAGHATRLGGLAFSKELLPVRVEGGGSAPLEPVCLCLLRAMRATGMHRVLVVARQGKWDLLRFLADRGHVGLDLAYVLANPSLGPSHSLELACAFAGHARVAMGFPDILFKADGAFSKLAERQRQSNADVVIGTFPSSSGQQADRVQADEHGSVLGVYSTAPPSDPRPSWCLAVWTPSFTRFLLRHIRSGTEEEADRRRRQPVGDLLQAAINRGLRMMAVSVSGRPFVDVGTAEGLSVALRGAN